MIAMDTKVSPKREKIVSSKKQKPIKRIGADGDRMVRELENEDVMYKTITDDQLCQMKF